MTTTDRTLPLLRWSTTVRCPRQAVYNAENAPARERTEPEERILFRGRMLGADYASLLIANHGQVNVEVEKKVEWLGGIGHVDAFLIPTGTVVEVLSSMHASEQMRHVKLLQAVGYADAIPESKVIMLVVLNPATFEEDRTVVLKGTSAYDALLLEARDRVEQIRLYAQTGVLPERVCKKPSEARGRFCLHGDFCFAGWEPDDLPILEDPEVMSVAAAWSHAKQRELTAKAAYDEAALVRKGIEERLADRIEQPGSYQSGVYEIKRIDVADSYSVDSRKLAGYGIEVPDDCWKTRKGHVRWDIRRGSVAAELDYGDVPWSEEDLAL